jgi:hypothetical protein
MLKIRPRVLAAIVAGTLLFGAAPAGAQAWHYAAMQPADVTSNEVNFIISGFGDYGTSFVGQYRWAVEKRTQLWADIGLASASGETPFLIGIAGLWNFITPSPDKPIDVSATLGVYGAFASDIDLVRIPIGIDVGHTWTLDNKHQLQGFAYPRISFDICSSGCSGTTTNLDFDLGVGYEFTKAMYGRAAFTFGAVGDGDAQAGFGISLAIKTK